MGSVRKKNGTRTPTGPTRASVKLDRLMESSEGASRDEIDPAALAIRENYIRSQLSRWCTAKRQPTLNTMIKLRELSGHGPQKHCRACKQRLPRKDEISLEMWAEKA
jgi:hypothetical protein